MALNMIVLVNLINWPSGQVYREHKGFDANVDEIDSIGRTCTKDDMSLRNMMLLGILVWATATRQPAGNSQEK